MSFNNSHLTDLTDLINAAVQDVISEYAAVGKAVSTLDSLESGPFDILDETPAKLSRAIQIIEAACAQLVHTVASPGHILLNKALEHEEPACLLVIAEAKIADLLLNRPEGVHVDELARSSGLEAAKLGRILRVLATKHCFQEVQPEVFANNRLNLKLLSTNATSSMVGLVTDEGLLASAYLNETMTNPSEKDNGIPFQRATGHAFFDYYKLPEGKRKGERFNRAMAGWSGVMGKGLVAKVYPWASAPSDSVVCDVGGGNGHVTMDLIEVHPHLRIIVQDQPNVINQAQEFWSQNCQDAIKNKRVEFIPFDFFQDAAAADCDLYYIRSILHSWRDAESMTILKNVRKVMKPSSKLIIHDAVLRHAVRDPASGEEQEFDYAPEPLLPNWGAARARTYHLDLAMMNLFNASVRTLPEFIELCKMCDLKFNKFYPAGEMDLIEFVPV